MLQASSFKPHTLEGALFLVILSEIKGDTTLAFGGYPWDPVKPSVC